MSITCPKCGMTSHNPNDERQGYCGKCHAWTSGGSDARCRVCGCSEERACEGGCAWLATEPTPVCTRCHFLRPGQPVWYYPSEVTKRAFAAVIASEPRRLGDDWVVRLEGLGPEYGEAHHGGKERTSVAAAHRLALRPRDGLHEKVRQVLHWATEALAEQDLNGQLSSGTVEQLRRAVEQLEPDIIPSRADCGPKGGRP